jgi:catechol 2,3-dioxygenase-like lactoylglutathione lyase family enzyme
MIRRFWSITLTVSDIDEAVHFYETVLGLPMKYRFGDYAGFDCGGVEIGMRTWGERENPREGEPCLDLMVDDVDEMYADLRERGVNFVQPPKDAQWGARYAVFTDPDGNKLQLTQVDWSKYYAVCAGK